MGSTRSPNRENGLAKPPALSVVMPVHNAAAYLDAAIESIVGQTYPDFEFVIVDDGSTDGSTDRLRHWAERDSRIRLLEERTNLGPVASSEKAARAARGPIVARMDADDISLPTRLEEQLRLFDDPEVGLSGTLAEIVDCEGSLVRGADLWRLTRKSWMAPFAHGSIMYRKTLFDRLGGYRRECEYWEDQDLIARFAAISRIVVIPRALYKVRQTDSSVRAVTGQDKIERAMDLAYRSADELAERGTYGDVLHPADVKLDPRVFIALGSVSLWAGGKPRLFRRLLKRARLGFNRRTLGALAWTAWASLDPRSLRAFMGFILEARNRASGLQNRRQPVEWRPGATFAVRER
jgi:glycosyltransferase involved in cell wall biosynthesis